MAKFMEKGGGVAQLERLNKSLRRTYGSGVAFALTHAAWSRYPRTRPAAGLPEIIDNPDILGESAHRSGGAGRSGLGRAGAPGEAVCGG